MPGELGALAIVDVVYVVPTDVVDVVYVVPRDVVDVVAVAVDGSGRSRRCGSGGG